MTALIIVLMLCDSIISTNFVIVQVLLSYVNMFFKLNMLSLPLINRFHN